jgi:hypothetical protein
VMQTVRREDRKRANATTNTGSKSSNTGSKSGNITPKSSSKK